MMLLGFLLFGCLASLAHGSQMDCKNEVISCLHFYKTLSADTILLDSKFSLKEECRLYEQFFSCLVDAALICETKWYSYWVPYLYLRDKNAINQLCTDGTYINKKYMAEHVCILLQNMDHCPSVEYDEDYMFTVPSTEKSCRMVSERERCIVFALQNSCGMEAGRLYEELTAILESYSDCELPFHTVDVILANRNKMLSVQPRHRSVEKYVPQYCVREDCSENDTGLGTSFSQASKQLEPESTTSDTQPTATFVTAAEPSTERAGLASLAHGTETHCTKELLKCTRLYRRLSADVVLFDSKFSFDEECKLQQQFFSCLEVADKTCRWEGRPLIRVHLTYLRKLDAIFQLCTDGTSINKKYKAEYVCILLLNVKYCSSEEYLGADLRAETSLEKICLMTTETRLCIAAELKRYCGVEASNLYEELTTLLAVDDDCAPRHVSGYTSYLQWSYYIRQETMSSEAQGRKNGVGKCCFREHCSVGNTSDIESRTIFSQDCSKAKPGTSDSKPPDTFALPVEISGDSSGHRNVEDYQSNLNLEVTSSPPKETAQQTQLPQRIGKEREVSQEPGSADTSPFATETSDTIAGSSGECPDQSSNEDDGAVELEPLES